MAIVGHFALILTFLAALYGAGAAAYGALRHRPVCVASGRLPPPPHAASLAPGPSVAAVGHRGVDALPGLLRWHGRLLRESLPPPVADDRRDAGLGAFPTGRDPPPPPARWPRVESARS